LGVTWKTLAAPTSASQTANYTSPCGVNPRGAMCIQRKLEYVLGSVTKIQLAHLAQVGSDTAPLPNVTAFWHDRGLARRDFGDGAEHCLFANTCPEVLVWIKPCPSQSIAARSR
jgi:hypothetical protein